MGNRNLDRLDKLDQRVGTEQGDENGTSTKSGVGRLLPQRDTTLAKIASGKQRTVQLLMIPPSRVRMWSEHNRRYDLLSLERCSDLVQGFTRAGRQEFAAIVRKIDGDRNHDFELICGARRHWAAAHLGWDLLVEARELNDRQAFTLGDLENRDREDISDYERAVDYKKALPKYFENHRAQMAQFLEINKGNFNRLLDLADLPKPILEAYADIRDLKVHHGAAYKNLMADSAAKRRILDYARTLKGKVLPGPKVFADIKKATKGKGRRTGPATRSYGVLSAQKSPKGAIQLSIPAGSHTDTPKLIPQLRRDFAAFLKDLAAQRL